MNIAQMFGFKVTREDLDRERAELFNCYECAAPLIGPLCPACNPERDPNRHFTAIELRLVGLGCFMLGVMLGGYLMF